MPSRRLLRWIAGGHAPDALCPLAASEALARAGSGLAEHSTAQHQCQSKGLHRALARSEASRCKRHKSRPAIKQMASHAGNHPVVSGVTWGQPGARYHDARQTPIRIDEAAGAMLASKEPAPIAFAS